MAHGLIDLAVQWSEGRSSWIQVMTTGEWDHPQLGKIRITQDDLAKFAENFDRKVRGVDLAMDVSHNPDSGAVGWFKELRVEGDKLMARVEWTEEGEQLVRGGKYRYVSPEFMFQWTDPANGKNYKDVLLGAALTNRPFLKNMDPVALSETSDMYVVTMAEGEGYDPDHDGDDDSTTNPQSNPDWMQDVVQGITKWPSDPKQQKVLTDAGHTKAQCDAAYKKRQNAMKMMETDFSGYLLALFAEGDGVTNAHKSPPAGKPQDKGQYADPDHYKYPIDEAHVKAAVGYFNQSGQKSAGGYSDDQWASIGRKIAVAANKHIGPGHEFKDGKIATPSKKLEDGTGGTNPNDGVTQPHSTDDTDSGQFGEGSKPKGGVKMTGHEGSVVSLAEFQQAQQKIQMLEAEARRAKLTEKARGWMFDEASRTGKIVPAQQEKVVEMMMGMSDDQVQKFEEFVKELPAGISFGEHGTAAAAPGGKVEKSDQVVKLAEKKMREEHMEWKEAFIAASDELGVK